MPAGTQPARSQRAVWLSGSAAAALFAGLAWYLAPLEPGVVALQLTFTPRSFAHVVHAWPAEHLARFRNHLPVDCLLLLAYGAFGYLLATRTRLFAGLAEPLRAAAALALPLAAAFDAVENALHAWLTAAPRFDVAWLYAVAGTAAAAKWVLLLGFGALLLGALVRGHRA